MGGNKTTGDRHNKNSSKYKSTRTAFKIDKRQQHTLMKFLKNVRSVEEEDESQYSVNNNIESIITDTETSPPTIDLEDKISIEEINSKEVSTGDETSNFKAIQNNYIMLHQIQEKRETAYHFAIYSAKQKGCLCKACSEFAEGTENWITLAAKLNQHPTRTLEGHVQLRKHTSTIRTRQEVKQMLVKGQVYKQVFDGEGKQMVSTKERNRRVIQKLLKTSYFIVKKKMAL